MGGGGGGRGGGGGEGGGGAEKERFMAQIVTPPNQDFQITDLKLKIRNEQ